MRRHDEERLGVVKEWKNDQERFVKEQTRVVEQMSKVHVCPHAMDGAG